MVSQEGENDINTLSDKKKNEILDNKIFKIFREDEKSS